MNTSTPNTHEKVVIIGSGPGAHTAAIYLSRAELQPLMFEGRLAAGVAAGGQLATTTDVENFPGFPDGIGGYEFTERLREQSSKFGSRILTETVSRVDLSQRPYTIFGESGTVVTTDSIVIATGATARRLAVGDEYWQRGVSACAVCDGAAPIFRRKTLIVVGGGDSAMEEAIFLTKYASKVIVVHRRDDLRASKIMATRARKNPKIEFLLSHEINQVKGDGSLMTSVLSKSLITGETLEIPASGLFFAIGHEPNVKFLDSQVALDGNNYIITKPDSTTTSVPGVFAAGDVQDKKWRQAITAAGTGAMAALEVEAYMEENMQQHETEGLPSPAA
ncbi:Thioredoxin reductase (Fragment) [Seminavis robusta]|uniref:Thioredoxin reductase n=1 Tax=Seminavis robusta TaxID=568900 RepID=A0A9N8H953_9STRA